MKSRVFQVEPTPRFDVTECREKGEIVYVGEMGFNPFDGEIVSKVASRLTFLQFDPEKDYVCLTGSQLSVSLFLAVLTAMYPNQSLKLLMFHAKTSHYQERSFNPEAELSNARSN